MFGFKEYRANAPSEMRVVPVNCRPGIPPASRTAPMSTLSVFLPPPVASDSSVARNVFIGAQAMHLRSRIKRITEEHLLIADEHEVSNYTEMYFWMRMDFLDDMHKRKPIEL